MRDETQLIVKGVICRAPELKIMKTGKPFVVIDVAVNKLNKTTNEKYAEFVSVYVTDEWLISGPRPSLLVAGYMPMDTPNSAPG